MGAGSLVKNALFGYAKAKLANTAARGLMSPAIERIINTQAAKSFGKIADTASTNFLDGAGHAGTSYLVENTFNENSKFSSDKFVDSMIQGGAMRLKGRRVINR